MKKKGLLLAAAIGVCGTVCANTKVVSIEFKDLTKKSFVLSESPKFQYRNDSLVVNGSASTAYPFQNVSKFYFEDSEESGIPAVASNEVRVTYLDNQNILVEGLKAGSNVELFSLLGQLIEKKSTKDGEALQFKLPNDKGVYVLKVDNQSIKIVKK
ncbi:MAG: T9SS type A sorting domain-containing protein [Paludibacteraceae bacterium]|nr:T9SS type A sorting domain-containing protein [Paludibacteraceae bacterium]